MYSKGSAFVIVLVALALIGGAVVLNPSPEGGTQLAAIFSWWNSKTATTRTTVEKQTADTRVLADIERELGLAEKTGGISPTAYGALDIKLKALESKGVNAKKARAMLAKLKVGGKKSPAEDGGAPFTKGGIKSSAEGKASSVAQSQFAAVKREIEDAEKKGGRFGEEHSARVLRDLASFETGGYDRSEIERLRQIVYRLSPHIVDKARAEEEARKAAKRASAPSVAPTQDEGCVEAPPVLVADITDVSKIQKITAPGTASSEGPKGHSFIWTGGARVPIYAPVAGIFDSGSYSKDHAESKAQYLLFFRVKEACGFQFKFDHIDEPVSAIRAELPSTPKIADSRGTPSTKQLEFAAGELIGYTSGNAPSGNWDFGLYNMNKQGALSAHGCYASHCNSVCWPDFFSVKKRDMYRRLLEGPELVCSPSAQQSETAGTVGSGQSPKPVTKTENNSEPPLLLKSIGVDLGYFDAATGRAGDFVFTRNPLQFNVLLTEFGFTIPANQSATRMDKRNPQPTFELPMGTKVRSLVDGIVVEVPRLYSGDYSIMVAPSSNSNWRYETEHVANPLVKVGDRVTAGEVIAEVSPHSSVNNSGYGLVEIGILNGGGNTPEHLCPFAYLDPSIKDDIQKKLRAFYKSWEEYRGDNTLHNEAAQPVPGCLSLEPIKG
ncbi:MAG: peptidoglycan DD-metalloendopeptidase family protein [Candidatus Taylorbacteria bacterium]|nr:peptidoglycan DD-metalloendopeptidase family protein [Candidatus Taylorbacteria bacterium]